MKQYWPMATYKTTEPSALGNKLFTYDSCTSMDEAKEVISRWANECGYHLLSAWIDCDLDGRKRKITLLKDDRDRRLAELTEITTDDLSKEAFASVAE